MIGSAAVMVRRVLQRTAGRHELVRRAPADSDAESPASAGPGVRWGLWFLAAGLGALGLSMRLWLLWHKSINSDEAVVGLMARDILHGHFSAFYWGQDYGGVEPYVTAALFGVFGQNDVTLNLAPAVLSAVIVCPRLADRQVCARGARRRDRRSRYMGVARGGRRLQHPREWLSLRDAHPRPRCVLFATQIRRRGSTWPRWLCFGLSIGAVRRSSPESVYFLVPCALLAFRRLLASRTVRSVAAHLGTFLAGALVGALPLLWVAVRSGLGVIVNPTGATYPGSTTCRAFRPS